MKKSPVSRKLALAVAGASAVIALSGSAVYAVSSAVANSSAIIHGCVGKTARNGTRDLLIRETGRSCPKGTTALNWNQQGPAGSSTAGPQGLDVIEVTAVNRAGTGATATCPKSHPYVIGGGGSVGGGPSLATSEPIVQPGEPGSWAVGASSGSTHDTADAYALCAR
jgi:hypothetical protein